MKLEGRIIKLKSRSAIPDGAKVRCTNEHCNWKGKAGDCRIGWEVEDRETGGYRLLLCPECFEDSIEMM